MRRLYISEPLVERRFSHSRQYRIVLTGSENQELTTNLLGLLYGLVDELEIHGATPLTIRLKYDAAAKVSGRITSSSTCWKIGLSQMELEVWLKFLASSLLDMVTADHIDLIDETPEKDFQFTLAIAGKIEAVSPAEA